MNILSIFNRVGCMRGRKKFEPSHNEGPKCYLYGLREGSGRVRDDSPLKNTKGAQEGKARARCPPAPTGYGQAQAICSNRNT